MLPDVAPEPTMGSTITVRVWAALLALMWGYFSFGLYDLLVFLQGPDFYAGTMLETGWGLLFLVLVAAPLVAVAVAPRAMTVTALQQVYLVAASLTVAMAVSASAGPLIVVAGAVGSAQLLAACTGTPLSWLRRPRRWSWWPGVVVLAGVAPGLAYFFASASSARSADPYLTWDLNHWPVQAALPLAVLSAGALAATYPPRWQVPAWCAAVGAGWFGVLAWTHPQVAASVSRPWAAAAVIWSGAFLSAVYWGAAQRTRSTRPVVERDKTNREGSEETYP